MLSSLHIDFAAREFCWAIGLGLICALVVHRRAAIRVCRGWNSVHPAWQMVGVFVVMLLIQWSVAARYGWPVPALHDEFSYLLAADTFAAGRATNPTHPAWEFLETYHVIWLPSYQSKYPPGNGLVLALGQRLTGQAIIGTWVCLAAATAGLYWMLAGWLAKRWALIGSVILICNWPVTKLWGQTYFGGGLTLAGGVLVYGALARLLRRPDSKSAIALGCGLVIWTMTRPYEGLVASLPAIGMLGWHYSLNRPALSTRLLRVALPAVCVITAGLGALGWYHDQVTGDPWKWPYRVYEETYTKRVNPLNTLISWTEMGERKRTIPSFEPESSAGMIKIASKPVVYAIWKIIRQWWFHIGLIWTIPFLVACGSLLSNRENRPSASRQRILLALASIFLVGMAILLQRSAGLPHYAAPVQPLAVLLIVEGLRRIRVLRAGHVRWGSFAVSWFLCSSMLFLILPFITGSNTVNIRPWSLVRQRIQQELEQRPRPSLVIVKYAAGHSMHEEWVYNRADIDRAKVVWAREPDSQRIAEFLKMFPGSDVWVVTPDQQPVAPVPFAR